MATITGTSGNDSLTGTSGNDTISGFGGNDLILAGSTGGADVIDGGTGSDSIEFKERATSAVVVDFVAGTISGGSSGTISFTNIERVVGGNFNDRLSGNGAGQTLTGQAGADTLWGAGGVDTLWGGAGADTFIFRETGTGNADVVRDWASGSDKLLLDASVMSALGATGNFVAGDARFKANSTGTATDASDRVIYNTSNGQVWYDADGNGAGARQLIATLQSGATLVATDIVVEGSTPPSGGQVINGTSGNDSLSGTSGNDTISGLSGNDLLVGNPGADSMRGGDGNDTLISGEGTGTTVADDSAADTLDGGLGDDVYHVVQGDIILADPGGIDTVIAWSNWTLGPGLENLTLGDDAGIASDGTGNELDNRIISATEGGTISGLGGNDTLIISGGQNTISALGGEGNDTIQGRGSAADHLVGDAGNDLLMGRGDFSTMSGGAGADVFLFDTNPFFGDQGELITDFAPASDTLRLDGGSMAALGASGRFSAGDPRFATNGTGTAQDSSDRVIYNSITGELWYDANGSDEGEVALIVRLDGAPALAATDIEVVNGSAPSGSVINGTSGNDTLSGTAGNDTINGFGGNDLFLAGSTGGADVIDGGTGSDSIEFKERATSGVVVDFASGTITGGGPGTISFTGVERVVGGNFNDQMTGNAAGQTLTGQAGADTLWGAGGADTLWGGGGAADTFIFREMGSANADRVSDFTSAVDKIGLDDSAFTVIGASGNFAAGDARFAAGAGFTSGRDASDRVVYNTSTGSLYYDADGSGAGAAQLIATLLGNPAIAATDIAVI